MTPASTTTRGPAPDPRTVRRAAGAVAAWATAAVLALVVLVPVPAAVAAVEVYPVPASRQFTVTGHGWGHGRGMSQYGAYEAARQGVKAGDILDFYYPGAPLAVFGNSVLRVHITGVGDSPTRVLPHPGLRLRAAGGPLVTLPAGPAYVEWRVRSDGAGMHVEHLGADGTWVPWSAPGVPTTIAGRVALAADTPLVVLLRSGERRALSGHLEAVPTGGGAMVTVNHVTVEEYLRGVVPLESPPAWPAAALQAQAVAARTYAVDKLVRSAGRGGWDICDTTACQVYGGVGAARASTDLAVFATAGLIKTSDGRTPITAEFSSSNGGVTADGGRSYLPKRTDPWDLTSPNPYRDWSTTLTAATVESRFPAVGRLSELRVVRREGVGDWGGRVAEVHLVGSGGTVVLTRETEVRFGLRSAYYRIEPTERPPFGNLEVVAGAPDAVRVKGWAIDPDTAAPIRVRVSVGTGTLGDVVAGQVRPDVGAAYPQHGSAHGFDATLPSPTGRQTVCVDMLDDAGGPSVRQGCTSIDVPGRPIGNLERVAGSIGTVEASGWVLDPDLPDAVTVTAWLDGVRVDEQRADLRRDDVGAAYPGYGALHGFSVSVPSTGGRHQFCLRAVDLGGGGETLLGCRDVDVVAGEPVGNLESLTRVDAGVVTATGWVFDPNRPAPVDVHVYVDGRWGGAATADRPRADVAAVYPSYGPSHGFSVRVAAPPGAQVCVYGINVGPGQTNPSLGCRTA